MGDITPHDNITKVEKHALEEDAFKSLLAPLAGTAAEAELWGLWTEYEAGSSPEAIYVKQLDRLEMITQGIVYETMAAKPGVQLDSFFASTPLSLFSAPHLRDVAEAVHAEHTTQTK